MSGLGQLIAPGGGPVGGWDAEQQRQNELRLQAIKLREAQQQQQAIAALGAFMQQRQGQPAAPGVPPMGPGPAMGGPGQSMAQPMAPMGGGGGQMPIAQPGGGGGPGNPAAPIPQQQPQPQPMMGGGPYGGGMDLQTLAIQIKRANPKLDDAALFQAIQIYSGMLNAQGKAELDRMFKLWAHEDRLSALTEKMDAALLRSKDQELSIEERRSAASQADATRLAIENLRQQNMNARQERGIDARAQLQSDRERSIDDRLTRSLQARNMGAGQKAEAQRIGAQYKALLAQRQDIDGQLQQARFEISQDTGDPKAAQAKIQQLMAKRSQVNNQIIQTWNTLKKSGLDVPTPAELLSSAQQEQGGDGAAPAGGGTPAGAAAVPKGGAETTIKNAVPPEAIAYLKQHPELREQFDAKYGAGSAASILGE